jgi:ribosomal protein S18 acetylase RimI-like enzyme
LTPLIRLARPEDYEHIVAVLDQWWGRPVAASLPRLFLDHFFSTSHIAEDEQGLAGFLVGFISPARPEIAYAHFIGVRPDQRDAGLARALYAQFGDHACRHGCSELWAITSPTNDASIRFHQRLGFTVSGPRANYNGPSTTMVTLRRKLSLNRPGADGGSSCE